MSIFIKNAYILTMDKNSKDIFESNIYIENDTIAYIGNKNYNAKYIEDFKGKIVLPGFINAHTHIPMSIFRNFADDLELNEWLEKAIWPIEAKMEDEDIYNGSMLSIAEMLACGTTCFCDMYEREHIVANACVNTAMRGFLCEGMTDLFISKEQKLESSKNFIQKYNNTENNRIKCGISPHAIYTCSEEFLKGSLELAKELDVPIHIHMSENKKEYNDSLEKHKKTPIEYIFSLGYDKHRVIAAHCVYMTQKEMDVADAELFFPVHNPSSNMKLASGIAPIYDMQKKGITVSIGTDGQASNNNVNMLEEMHLTSLLAKVSTLNPKAINAYETLQMATINAAKALGIENQVGSIEVGKKADLAVFSLDSLHLQPINNICSSLVYSMQNSDVYATYVDGRLMYKKGEFFTLDKNDIIKKAKYSIEKLKSKTD